MLELEFMRLALAVGAVVGILAPAVGFFLVERRQALVGDGLGHVAFAGVAAGYLLGIEPVLTALALRQGPSWQGVALSLVRTPTWLLVFPLVLALHGLTSYLGLRTAGNFTMFSNLRTEGGISNHLFMPRRLVSLADYQEDLVEILETDDVDFAEYREQQLLLPYFEFRRMMSGIENVRVTYLRGGQQHSFECKDGHCNDAELAQPYSGLVRRLLYFRPVDKGPRMLCRH